ncbi:hypothetical protein P280DRAFT_464857 [Massarina eburnea CBS 473.64]|uniref:Uncharacterized protein n=1 Tax=Massarina eburnea CBS 473.64 TaxID=1395130 RepID=A0A6A6SI82_9PLEO|nr:hypothetical protein P280DRAFT_464857 [Massarina eburnea CBS 473.64]
MSSIPRRGANRHRIVMMLIFYLCPFDISVHASCFPIPPTARWYYVVRIVASPYPRQ